MSEATDATAISSWTGSLDLYHPRGPRVRLPVLAGYDYAAAFAAVSAALDAGFLAAAPGLEQGEEKESIGWCVRTGFERDGRVTPSILLYAADENLTYSVLKVYLDTPEQIDAFEYASGMKLNAMPDYEGSDKPERGKSAKLERYFVKAAKPFGAVWKHNRKYDEQAKAAAAAKGEVYKVPRRLFVRWENVKPAANGTPPKEQQPGKIDRAAVSRAEAWLAEDPPLHDFNAKWALIKGDSPTALAIRTAFISHASGLGLTEHPDTHLWFNPRFANTQPVGPNGEPF